MQVLHAFASEPRECERLAYFATAEGREDLYRCAVMTSVRLRCWLATAS